MTNLKTKDGKLGTIALDCDGVLLDFLTHWEKMAAYALGRTISVAKDTYDLKMRYGLTQDEIEHVMEIFVKEDGWSNLPPLPGAIDGAIALQQAGHRVVVVTAIDEEFTSHRLDNFKKHGFTPDHMYCVGAKAGHTKTAAYEIEQPVAVVDDRLTYLNEAKKTVTDHEPQLIWVNDGVNQHGHSAEFIHHEVVSLYDWAQPLSQGKSASFPVKQRTLGF
jgi:uncharacterized HAD superfamily protein